MNLSYSLKTYGVIVMINNNTSKEFHVFTLKKPDSDQAFVFNVTRNNDTSLHIHEIWIITQINGGEVKSIIDLDKMANLIGVQEGGNVDKSKFPELIETFKDVLPPHTRHELNVQTQIYELEELASKHFAEALIKAAEAANVLHQSPFKNGNN